MPNPLKKVKEFFNKPKESVKEEEKEKEENLSMQFQLDDPTKDRIREIIVAQRDESRDTRTSFMDIRIKGVKQYEGIKEESDIPWPGHSNISTMVTTVACDLLHSKLFPMVWNAKSISWEGVEEHDVEIADINRQVMSFVTSTDMKMQNTIDDLVHMLVVDGTIMVKKIWKSYWVWVTRKEADSVEMYTDADGSIKHRIKNKVVRDYIKRERCYLELRPIENVYIPYDANTYEKNWEDLSEYIIDERWFTLDMLKELQYHGAIDQSIDLDGAVKGAMDNLEEFKGTEKERASAEGTVAPGFDIKRERYKVRCLESEMLYDIDGDGKRERCVFLIAEDLKLMLSAKPMHAVSRVGRSSWVIRPFIRRPGRAYGKSIPELVRHHHEELDAIHNQRIDAGNMSIAPFFFYRAASGVKARRIITGPATGIPLDDPERDVRFPTFPTNGLQVSFQEEKLLMELIERLTYLTPAMLGKETASRPTARGTLAVIAQGEQKFGLIGSRVQAIVCDILTDIRQQYEEHMPPESWARILGKENVRKWPSPEAMIGQYEAKMQLDLTAMDLDAERNLAAMMYQTMAFDPMVMQNPAFMWEVRADYLKALRRVPVEKYIGPRPETEATPKDADDIFSNLEQEMSNIPVGDPSTLIPRLMELKKSERYNKFTPEAKALFNDYIRKLRMSYVEQMMKGAELNGRVSTQTSLNGAGGAPQAPGMGGFGSPGARTMPVGGNQPGGGPPAAAGVSPGAGSGR